MLWSSSVARIYGCGDKNGKLLHNLVSYHKANRIIPEICDAAGTHHFTSQAIAQAFVGYYADLYAVRPP